MPRRFFLLTILAWPLWTSSCSRQPTPDTPASTNAPAAAVSPAATEEEDLVPQVGGVPDYAGSGACQGCHEKQHASWHRSFHRTMTQLPVPDAVQADFNNVVLTNAGVRYLLSRKGGEFRARLESATPGTPDDPAPEPVEMAMGMVTGSHHMQVYWVANGMGNCQVGFPFTWLIPERRWVPRNSTFLRPPSVELRPETWNHVCARCHATATQPNYDRSTKTWNTQVQDLGIACEACHGPGQRHVAQQEEVRSQGLKSEAIGTNFFIVHPEKISSVRAAQICGFCHSMKWFDRKEGWPERGFSYRPGDDLEASTPIIRPREIERQPWLRKVVEGNPTLLADFFWSDGMVRVSGRDYNGLIESPCFQKGSLSCLSCHSLHDSETNGQLARNRSDHRACTQCHEKFRDETALVAHTHHLAKSTGTDCYNCHMPRTTYGVLKAIRSHQITSPNVQVQLATGRPNACNLCHLDRPLAWVAQELARWYQQPLPQLTEDHSAVADAVQWALQGDAGQRVLIAWHLGWEPAWVASGKSWIAPVLAQLLEDPYAAVRCVAERSMKRVDPKLLPADYDFTVAPESHRSVQGAIREGWRHEMAGAGAHHLPAATLVRLDQPFAEQEEVQRLLRRRDNRPVRLRE